MLFTHTIGWLDASPFTGKPKRSTLREIKRNQSFSLAVDPSDLYAIRSVQTELQNLIETRADVFKVVSENRRQVYEVGKEKTVQAGRGKKGERKILIERIQFASPQSLTQEELIVEGFNTHEVFIKVWESIHGTKKFQVPCYLISFQPI